MNIEDQNIWQQGMREFISPSDEITASGKKGFKITREELSAKVKEYLQQGGTVTELPPEFAFDTKVKQRRQSIAAELCGSGRLIPRNYPEGYF